MKLKNKKKIELNEIKVTKLNWILGKIRGYNL